jgi:hypothetical protein
MKYSSRNILPNIKGVRLGNSYKVLGFTDRTLWVDGDKIAERIDTTTDSLKIFDNFLFFDKENESFIFDLKRRVLFETKQYRAYEKTLCDNTFICVYDTQIQGDKFTWHTGLYDFKKLKLIKEYSFLQNVSIAHYLNESFVMTYLKPMGLGKISLLTGEYEWEVDLGLQGLEIVSILGVWEDNLIVICKNEQKQQEILSLSVQLGKEVWRKNMQVSQYAFAFSEDKTSILYVYAGGLWLNGEQITRGRNIFREVNTKDGSVRREGVLRQLDEAGLGLISYQLLGGFIYFRAVYQSFGDTVIGVLDYETLSLLWWEEVKIHSEAGYFAFLRDMQASENKIYALDQIGTLHIYERDESVPFVKPTASGLQAFEELPIEPETKEENTDEQDFSDLPF